MPFDPNSAKKAGKKSKRGPAKKEGPSIKEKMEILYEKVLDDLLINQEKLTKTERVKLFVTLSNYIFPIHRLLQSETKIYRSESYCEPNPRFHILELFLWLNWK